MSHRNWLIFTIILLLTWIAFSTEHVWPSEVHLAVGIEYSEPTESDCSQAAPNTCSKALTDLQRTVVEIDGITDDFPKSIFEVPATRPSGGGFIQKVFCVKTNTSNLSRFEAEVYAEDLSGNKSPKAFTMAPYMGGRAYCGPSVMQPLPENFRATP